MNQRQILILENDKLENVHEAIIDPIKTSVEYSVVKEMLEKSSNSGSNMAQFYAENIHNNLDLYPNIGRLYAIALTCPCTSVECERGFSKYNLNQNKPQKFVVRHTCEPAVNDFNL